MTGWGPVHVQFVGDVLSTPGISPAVQIFLNEAFDCFVSKSLPQRDISDIMSMTLAAHHTDPNFSLVIFFSFLFWACVAAGNVRGD